MQSFSATGRARNPNDLRTRLDATTPTYVLIDPMLGEPLPALVDTGSEDMQIAREAAWNRRVTRIQLGAKVSLPQQQHPYLVALTGLDDALIDDTFEIANSERLASQQDGLSGDGGAAHRVGGWLQSTLHQEDLAAHLLALLRVNTSALTKATYCRLVDRRVLALLCHTIGERRVRDQFGRLQRWVYLDAGGGLAALESGGEVAVPFKLSAAEWEAMAQGEALHRATAQWLGELAIDGQKMYPAADETFRASQSAVAQAMGAAEQWPWRFSGLPDISAYAATCLLHPGIFAVKTVRAMLAHPGTPDTPPELLRYMHPEIRQLGIADFDTRRM